ncbi:MAG: hypothetical protein HYX68_14515 [Planctomycetes bacterium]|nr:hypothetical protein [Planctomycetota bacterium]
MLTRTLFLFSLGVAAVLLAASQIEAQPGKGPKGFGKGGKGFGKGPKGAGADVKKLEADLERLLEQVKETKAKLAKAQGATGGFGAKGKGKADFFKKKGGFGKGEFSKKDFFKKKKGGFGKEMAKPGFPPFGGKKMEGFGKGKKGFGPKSPWGKPGSDSMRAKYEFYKKMFEGAKRGAAKGERGKGKGERGMGGWGGWGKGPWGKGGFGPPKGFQGKKKEMTRPGFGPAGKAKGPGKGPGGFSRGGQGGASVEARIDRLIRELEQLRSEVKGKRKR